MLCPICIKLGRGPVQFETEDQLTKHRTDEHGELPPSTPAAEERTDYAGGPVIRPRGDSALEGRVQVLEGTAAQLAGHVAAIREYMAAANDGEAAIGGTLKGVEESLAALAASLAERGSAWDASLAHLASETGSLRDSIGRLATRDEERLQQLEAHLRGLEDQALGARIRFLEEKLGVQPDSGVSDLYNRGGEEPPAAGAGDPGGVDPVGA